MSQPITAISNLTNLQNVQGIHPAWLEAGYGIVPSTPTYYNWQTLLTDLPTGVTPRQSLDSLPAINAPVTTVSDLTFPRDALPGQFPVQQAQQPAFAVQLPVQQAQQPVQQPASAFTGVLPQVPVGATGNGASAELNQLLNSTGTLTSDIVTQSAMLEQAQRQVEQQKAALQQQQQYQTQVTQLQQQNAILLQQVEALKQQATLPATLTTPLSTGSVASSNPYLVGLGNLGSVPFTTTMPSLYSPTFSTKGMGLSPSTTVSQASVLPSTSTDNGTLVSATPSLTATDEKAKKISDGKLTLVDIGVGDYQLDSEAANAFKKANEEVKKQTGEGIVVISAYRSPEHNERVGGAPNSNHTRGNALDLDQSAGNYQKSLQILEANGFKSLRGVTYDKPGSGPQDEENHLDFVGNKA